VQRALVYGRVPIALREGGIRIIIHRRDRDGIYSFPISESKTTVV
jgi:hypothetical protein